MTDTRKALTVKDLREKMEEMEKAGHGHDAVIVHCMGGLSGQNAAVENVGVGFDWESGQIVLHVNPVVTYWAYVEKLRKELKKK